MNWKDRELVNRWSTGTCIGAPAVQQHPFFSASPSSIVFVANNYTCAYCKRKHVDFECPGCGATAKEAS
jgi:hypothetical protein